MSYTDKDFITTLQEYLEMSKTSNRLQLSVLSNVIS